MNEYATYSEVIYRAIRL